LKYVVRPRELSMRVVLSRGALVTAAEGRLWASHQAKNSLSPGMGCSRLPADNKRNPRRVEDD
jgi:hypothetical protein